MTPLQADASATSTAFRISGLPLKRRSCFGVPILVEPPAASRTTGVRLMRSMGVLHVLSQLCRGRAECSRLAVFFESGLDKGGFDLVTVGHQKLAVMMPQ